MSGENYLINSTSVKVNEPCSVRIPNHIPELMNKSRLVVGGCSLDYENQTDIHPVVLNDENMLEMNITGQYKIRRSVDVGTGPGMLSCQDHFDMHKIYSGDLNVSTSKIPNRIIKTVNFCQAFSDQDRDIYDGNTCKLLTYPSTLNDLSSIPSNSTTYKFNTNGTQINKIKTANSSGSSFLVQTQQPNVPALPQTFYPTEINDSPNQSKYIKSQNIIFLQKTSDINLRKSEDEAMKSNFNTVNSSFISDESVKLAEYNNVAFGSSNKVSAANIPIWIDCNLSVKPEYGDGNTCDLASSSTTVENIPNLVSSDSNDSRIQMPLIKDESVAATDILYSNSFYLPTISVNEPRNSISYIGQAIPVVMLNSSVDLKNINAATHPQYCLTQLIPFSNDTVNTTNAALKDQATEGADTCSMLQREFLANAKLYSQHLLNEGPLNTEQFSCNNEQSHENDFSISIEFDTGFHGLSGDQLLPMAELTADTPTTTTAYTADQATEIVPDTIKTVGKFTITSAKVNDKSMSTLKSIENTEDNFNPSRTFNKYICNEDLNMNTNSGNQQPRSRFKKTRIRETIERWCINGLNTYDCRFKVIPTKIMSLQNNDKDIFANEYQLEPCGSYADRDNEYRCHSNEYYNKEFRFWDSGDRIVICGKADYDTENYCPFHAKYINLLITNQNPSLSKFEPQCFGVPNELLASSSSQIIRAVLISSPENENYTMNIDTNISQNVALSAPPVSPSIINSVPISIMPLNIHSPQPAASMVMLRCQTPVILTSATRSATLMHESISIERINHKPPTVDSDNTNVADQSADMWSTYPLKSNHLAFKFPSPGYLTDTVFPHDSEHTAEVVYNGQQSLYSVGPLPHILYSIQQQSIPTISPGVNTKQTLDHHMINYPRHNDYFVADSLSINMMHEIDNSLSSLKSLIHNLVQSEQQSLISDIKLLTEANEQLKSELSQVKKRSEYLVAILQQNHIAIDLNSSPDNVSLPDLSPTSNYQQHNLNQSQDDSTFDS